MSSLNTRRINSFFNTNPANGVATDGLVMGILDWIGFIGGGVFVALAVFGKLNGVEFDLDADPDLEPVDLEASLEQKRLFPRSAHPIVNSEELSPCI